MTTEGKTAPSQPKSQDQPPRETNEAPVPLLPQAPTVSNETKTDLQELPCQRGEVKVALLRGPSEERDDLSQVLSESRSDGSQEVLGRSLGEKQTRVISKDSINQEPVSPGRKRQAEAAVAEAELASIKALISGVDEVEHDPRPAGKRAATS